MKNQRGRKSAQALSAVTAAAAIESIPRQPPPCDLSEFEADVWVAVTNTKPSDWFTADTLPLLRGYCKHVSQAHVLDATIAEFDPKWLATDDGLERYDRLLKMRDRESRAMTALARSMRLTQQAQILPRKAGGAAQKGKAAKPWEDV